MNSKKNIDIQFSKICEKVERFFKIDRKIEKIIYFIDEEYDIMESYRDRLTEIRVIYEKIYNKHGKSKSEISSNYLKVIDHLKSRFERKDLLIEAYIRYLLALMNNKSAIKLTDLYNKLGSNLQALETLNVTTSNYSAMLYPVVKSCLPAEILKAWDRHRLNREVPEDVALEKERVLENLITFLHHEVEQRFSKCGAQPPKGAG
ncbi:transposable element Tc1 transposase [Trichonephila clavipes]|nr:transposable element Tc1 transposase [Trichonephila clavipes]